MKILSIFLLWFALSCNAQFDDRHQRVVTGNIKDSINETVVGALVKNGQLTSCNLAVIDSITSVVAASCLEFNLDKTVDENTKLEVIFDSESSKDINPILVDSVTVHPKFNPLSRVNNIAILQYNKNSSVTWHAQLGSDGYEKWEVFVYMGIVPNNVTNLGWRTSYGMVNLFSDETCEDMSDMFKENKYDMLCTSLTADTLSKDQSGCTAPMGTVYGITGNVTYLLGLHSYTALSFGDSLCSYSSQRSYYSILGNYAGFIQDTIGRELIWSPGFINETIMHIDSSYTMVDRNFTDLNEKYSTIIDGNFFKYDANYSGIDLSDSADTIDIDSSDNANSSGVDSSTNADKGTGLSQREIIILAVCISVGGAVIIALIVFYVWRRRWRNSNLADPIYRDVIETEIGGATVPAYALNGPVSHAQSLHESVANNMPASLQGFVGNEQNNANIRQGELPPTYNDVVVERRQSLLTSTENPDIKKNNE